MRYQVEHNTALMRAIRKDNEFAVDELIKASAKQNCCLDYENKVKSCLQLRCYHLQCDTFKVVGANLGLIIHTCVHTNKHRKVPTEFRLHE